MFVCCLYHDSPPTPTGDNPVFIFANGDMCIFRTLTVQKNHKFTCGCGGYIHGSFCGVQENNKSDLNKSDLMTYMYQKFA